MINDVSGGMHDPDMIPLSQRACIPMVYMHMRGTPKTMTQDKYCSYTDPIAEIACELEFQMGTGCVTGIPRWMQIVDPGIGFAKRAETCRDLLLPRNLRLLRQLLKSRPVMIGLSRKRFLEAVLLESTSHKGKCSTSIPTSDRDAATVGGCITALLSSYDSMGHLSRSSTGSCSGDLGSIILRVHNVKDTHDACVVVEKLITEERCF